MILGLKHIQENQQASHNRSGAPKSSITYAHLGVNASGDIFQFELLPLAMDSARELALSKGLCV